MTDTTETEMTDKEADQALKRLIADMLTQKASDDIDECQIMVEILRQLGIRSTFAQVWEEIGGQTDLTMSIVIPMSGLSELKNIVGRAVMAPQ
jgi:hypothetical protein